MKYTKEERLIIGERIYNGDFTLSQAAEKYDINFYTAREYLRAYKAKIGVKNIKPAKVDTDNITLGDDEVNVTDYSTMTRDELLKELLISKINVQRYTLGLEYAETTTGKYEIICNLSSQFPVKTLCKALDINKSTYYRRRKRRLDSNVDKQMN